MTTEPKPSDETTIRRSLDDLLANRVRPHLAVMAAAEIALVPSDAEPAARAVVWAQSALQAGLERLRADPAIGRAVAHAAAQLGRLAVGAPGRVSNTYETVVPGTPYALVFDLVTWTKAGEVIAILALADAPPPLAETPLWRERG